ncbi:MAG: flagellar hook capping protein [Lachnospiraceae bacterium]|nr:flagellar hook capping protein [Lachnospiraceae bacterium]
MGVVQEVKDGKLVDNTSATSIANEKAKKTGNSSLDKDAFLQLLVAQMKYQDPLEPTSNTEYISQFATFSELEQMQNMSATLELSRASSLVGQTVLMSVTDSQGRTTTVQGNVDFVSYEGGKAYLSIGGELYSLDDLDKVADKKYLDAYALAAEFLSILNKLPDVSLLTTDDKERVDRLEEIYNGMDDYQKGFLTDDYFEKAEAYIKRMKDITPNTDGDETPKTEGSGES